MELMTAIVSTLVNLIVLAGIPFLCYFAYHRLWHKRRLLEVAERAGLCLGDPRFVGYSVAFAAAVVLMLVLFPPALEPLVREGSSWHGFVGLGFTGQAVLMSLIYGVVKTGFAEELLFRGLIAGSLSRRLPLVWANLAQASIFLLPHLLLLLIAPEQWWLMPLIFAGSLLAGWLRIKSGSIAGPWLIHASVNVAMGLSVAIRTAG